MGLFDFFTDKLADAAGERIQDLTVGRLERRAGRAAGELIERGARRAADSVAQ
ncbi:MAG: hypothetical protein GXX90_07460, partial [Microbacteriaceae bacterium]|nr:hypothetical protein [Microbacteriaceae bacterium]